MKFNVGVLLINGSISLTKRRDCCRQHISTLGHTGQIHPFLDGMRASPRGPKDNAGDARGGQDCRVHPGLITINFGRMSSVLRDVRATVAQSVPAGQFQMDHVPALCATWP